MAIKQSGIRVVSVRFHNYKAFGDFQIRLKETNILVGPNNAGKSTLVGAFRALAVALRRMKGRKPDVVEGPNGKRYGIIVPPESLPISTENVHTNYTDDDALITFVLSNGNDLQLYFPGDRSCLLLAETHNVPLLSASAFQAAFPIEISVVPVLGPVEDREELVQEETVQRNLATHRASRNFRSYWYHFPNGFEEFAKLIKQTWPGIEVEAPSVIDPKTRIVTMFCSENRILRELYWVGTGFQVWCQLLTHLLRLKNSSLVVVDEPEIYLHADLQRQLIGILRNVDADVLIATHSTEMMGEAEPTDLVLVDKKNRTGERIKNVEKLQAALASVGSLHNVTLTRIAKSRRVLFTEGDKDLKVTRMIAKQCGYHALASGIEIVPARSDGFGSWEKVAALGWGIEKALGDQLAIGTLYDRDYFPDEEIAEVLAELEKSLSFVHIHAMKEIENYLLMPACLERALQSAITDRAKRDGAQPTSIDPIANNLMEITAKYKEEVASQRIGRQMDYYRRKGGKQDSTTLHYKLTAEFNKQWSTLEGRLAIVPGSDVLSELRTTIATKYGVSLSDSKIISAMREQEIPADFLKLLEKLERFRTAAIDG
jgi:hypothetical protein